MLESRNIAALSAGAVSKPQAQSAMGRPRRSLFRHAPLLILALIVVADLWQSTDPDLWGHIRFGQLMLSSGHVVSHDPYSYSAPGHPWHDHEYLTEVTMALVYNRAGIIGLKMWKFVCAAATVLLLAAALAETGASFAIQLNTLAVAVVAVSPHMQFRPQLYTYALLALMLAVLAADNYRRSAPLWLIIPAMVLWGNLHGGYVAGIVTLLAYAGAAGASDLLAGRGFRRGLRLGSIAVAGTLATLLTPYGVNTWRAVITTLGSPRTFTIFADWQPLTAAMRAQWRFSHYGIVVYLFLLALWTALVISVALRPRGGDFPLLVVAVIIGLGALRSVRNVPLAAIACVVPVARHLDLLLHGEIARSNGDQTRARFPPWAQWVVAGGALVLIANGLFSARLAADKAYPSGAVRFMKQHQLRGNVLGDFAWGEYLIWHLAPESKVFFDSRYDMVFSDKIIKDYIDFQFDLPQGRGVLRWYAHDFVLIPPASKAYGLMTAARGWQVVYRDPSAVLFARAGSPATKIPGAPLLGLARPDYFP